MSKKIKQVHPDCSVFGNKSYPRSGAFEVEINGKLVFSKFETSDFPTDKDIENWFI